MRCFGLVEDLNLIDYNDIKNRNVKNIELLMCLNLILSYYNIDLFEKQILFINKKSNNSLDVLMSEFNHYHCGYDLYYLETYSCSGFNVNINFDKEYKYSCKRAYN